MIQISSAEKRQASSGSISFLEFAPFSWPSWTNPQKKADSMSKTGQVQGEFLIISLKKI